MRSHSGLIAVGLGFFGVSNAVSTSTVYITTGYCPVSSVASPTGYPYVTTYTTTNSAGSSTIITSTVTGPTGPPSLTTITTTDSNGRPTTLTSTVPTPCVGCPSTLTIVTTGTDGLPTTITTTSTPGLPPTLTSTGSGGSGSSGMPTPPPYTSGTSGSGPPSTSTSASPAGPSAPCPAAPPLSPFTVGGATYQIFCNSDFFYNDLPAVTTDTFEGCLAACNAYVPATQGASGDQPCEAVTWTETNTYGANCYLKSAITSVQYGTPGYCSAKLLSYSPPDVSLMTGGVSSTGTTSSSATPSGLTLTGPNGYTNGTTGGSGTSTGGTGASTSGTDTSAGGTGASTGGPSTLTGGPSASTGETTSTGSGPIGYTSGTATPASETSTGGAGETSIGTSTSGTGPIGYTSTGTSATPSASGSCQYPAYPAPFVNSTYVTVLDGRERIYLQQAGVAYNYFDLPSTNVQSFTDCAYACDAWEPNPPGDSFDQPCTAFTFIGCNPNGNNCYLHYQAASPYYGGNPLGLELERRDGLWARQAGPYADSGLLVAGGLPGALTSTVILHYPQTQLPNTGSATGVSTNTASVTGGSTGTPTGAGPTTTSGAGGYTGGSSGTPMGAGPTSTSGGGDYTGGAGTTSTGGAGTTTTGGAGTTSTGGAGTTSTGGAGTTSTGGSGATTSGGAGGTSTGNSGGTSTSGEPIISYTGTTSGSGAESTGETTTGGSGAESTGETSTGSSTAESTGGATTGESTGGATTGGSTAESTGGATTGGSTDTATGGPTGTYTYGSPEATGVLGLCTGGNGGALNVLGTVYDVACGVSYNYQDVTSTASRTLQDCIRDCVNYALPTEGAFANLQCVAVTIDPGNFNGNTCYLHGPGFTITDRPGVASAQVINVIPSGGVSASVGTTSTGETSTAPSAGSTPPVVYNTPFEPPPEATSTATATESTPPVADYTSTEAAPEATSTATSTEAAPEATSTATSTEAAPDVTSTEAAPDATSTATSTEAAPAATSSGIPPIPSDAPSNYPFNDDSVDGTVFTAQTGGKYTLRANTALGYRDEPGTHAADTFELCMERCDNYVTANPGDSGDQPCVGVSWDLNSHDCYLEYHGYELLTGRNNIYAGEKVTS